MFLIVAYRRGSIVAPRPPFPFSSCPPRLRDGGGCSGRCGAMPPQKGVTGPAAVQFRGKTFPPRMPFLRERKRGWYSNLTQVPAPTDWSRP